MPFGHIVLVDVILAIVAARVVLLLVTVDPPVLPATVLAAVLDALEALVVVGSQLLQVLSHLPGTLSHNECFNIV